MAEIIGPQKLADATRQGFNRIRAYRKARAMFIRGYVGQYYKTDASLGKNEKTGNLPLALIFNAIRATVPHLVMQNPKHGVYTEYTELKDFAEITAKKLDSVAKQIKLFNILRSWIVDAFFGFGVTKTGIKETGKFVSIDNINVDPGQVFVETVDLDDFVFDPMTVEPLFTDASFVGNRVRVPRQLLLDSKGYDHDLVKALPKSPENNNSQRTRDISGADTFGNDYALFRDYIDVIELWVPDAEALVTIADPTQGSVAGYLREVEFHGPEDGPFTYLSFSQPVPGNPLPVAPVSLWYDLQTAANSVFKKSIDQALRQKDVILYNPANADTAKDIVDAFDGETIASEDPSAVNTISLGGSNNKNDQMVGTLQTWFNYMAGNPDQMAGLQSDVETATQAQIMQGNAGITQEDAKNILYNQTGEVSSKIAWYVADDPLDKTLEKEDWLEFAFSIVPKSMGKISPQVRMQRMMQLATNVIPAAAQTAQICLQMGTQFNFPKFVMAVAKELDLEDVIGDIFQDPEHIQKLATMMTLGAAHPSKTGGDKDLSMAGILQNGGVPNAQAQTPTPGQIFNQQTQSTAADAQSQNFGVM
jgi:hypothetical protein